MDVALSVVGAGGHVVCLNKGYYGGASITASITISCGDRQWDAGASLVTFAMPAGALVSIDGLVSDGRQTATSGVTFTGAGTLILRNSRIGDINGGAPSDGFSFTPSGPSALHVVDSEFYGNPLGAGIKIKPASGGYANVHIRNSTFHKSQNGLFVDGSSSTIGINVNIDESMFAENAQNGIGAFNPVAGGAPIVISVKNSQITGNLINGIGSLGQAASGPGSSVVEVNNSQITANNNGLATGGVGQILTFGNNQVRRNSVDGNFTGSAGLR